MRGKNVDIANITLLYLCSDSFSRKQDLYNWIGPTKKKKVLDYDRVLYQTGYRLQQGDLKSFPSSVSDQYDNFHKSHWGRLDFLHSSSWGSDQHCALWHSSEWIYCLITLGTVELFHLGKFQTVAWRNFNLRARSQLQVWQDHCQTTGAWSHSDAIQFKSWKSTQSKR